MQFEERTIRHSDDAIAPEYDRFEAISYVIDSRGHSVPYIEWSRAHLGTKTGDSTKTRLDDTDTDPADDVTRYN